MFWLPSLSCSCICSFPTRCSAEALKTAEPHFERKAILKFIPLYTIMDLPLQCDQVIYLSWLACSCIHLSIMHLTSVPDARECFLEAVSKNIAKEEMGMFNC